MAEETGGGGGAPGVDGLGGVGGVVGLGGTWVADPGVEVTRVVVG